MKDYLYPLVAPLLLALLLIPVVLVGSGGEPSFATGWTMSDMHQTVDRWRWNDMRVMPRVDGRGLFLHYVNSSGEPIPIDNDGHGGFDIAVEPTATFTSQSPDGVNWTKPVATNLPHGRQDWMSLRVRKIATVGDRYVGVGYGRRHVEGEIHSSGKVFSSHDGIRWREVHQVDEGWTDDVAGLDDRVIVHGNRGWVSTDGVRFNRDDRVAPDVFGNRYSDYVRWRGRTVWVGDTERSDRIIALSTVNGTRWDRATVGRHAVRPDSYNEWFLAKTDRRLVALTTVSNDEDGLPPTTETYVSRDAKDWKRCITRPSLRVSAMTSVGNRLVAFGAVGAGNRLEGAMWTSNDGCHWTREYASVLRDADAFYAAAAIDDRLVAIGAYSPGDLLSQKVPLAVWVWEPER